MVFSITALGFSLHGCSDSPATYKKQPATGEKLALKNESYRGLLVSNQPLYLLAKAATKGIEVPKKIMTGTDVGHHYHLKPSDRKHIQDADTIFWIGDELEAPLAKLLTKHPKAQSLLTQPAVDALPVRGVKGKVQQGSAPDPHIWLDPERAKTIVHIIAMQRAKAFPEYKDNYIRNSHDFAQQMDSVVKKLEKPTLNNQSNTMQGNTNHMNYIAYHDAYQYLEKPLHINLVGSLAATAEQPVATSQLVWLASQRQQLADAKPMCVLSETEAAASRITSLAPTTLVVIDESMQTATDFVSGWHDLAGQVQHCIGAL